VAKRVGFVPSATRVARSLKTTRSATTERERGSGEEGGIRAERDESRA
jgi:hypothetical protein